MILAKVIDGEMWIKAADHHQAMKDAKSKWVGLTNEDIVDCLGEPCWDDVVRKAEAKLKEKNTP